MKPACAEAVALAMLRFVIVNKKARFIALQTPAKAGSHRERANL